MTNPYFLRNILKKNAKKNRQSYTPDLIERALEDKRNGLSQRKAAKKYEIPISTLNDSYNKVRSSHNIGRKPILNEEIEEILCQILIRLSDVGVGLNKFEIPGDQERLSFFLTI